MPPNPDSAPSENLINTSPRDFSTIRVMLVDPCLMWCGLVGSYLFHHLQLRAPAVMATNTEDAIRQFRKHRPDLVITELNLAGASGPAMIDRLQQENAVARVLILTSTNNLHILRAGAATNPCGFVHKSELITMLAQSVEMALCGGSSKSPTMEKLLQSPEITKHRDFTKQELLVISLIAAGEPTKAIAEAVGRSEKAVESLRARLMKQMGVRTSAGLVRYAVREGFVEA